MNSVNKMAVFAALLSALTLISCSTTSTKATNTELQRKLDETRATLEKYETRYGKLPNSKPRRDYRKLKAKLLGKNMKEVVEIIGAPSKVYSLGGGKESWDYYDIARDEITGKPVRDLEIWFTKQVAARVEASF